MNTYQYVYMHVFTDKFVNIYISTDAYMYFACIYIEIEVYIYIYI